MMAIRFVRQHGQALPLALMLISAAAVSWIYLYNGGQIVASRARLTHAADAAAYSGALIQARALNMQAYINRAQIAHQVAMAHLVTLSAWAQFGATQAGQVGRNNPPASLIAMLFGPRYGDAYASASRASALGGLAGDLEQAYDGHDRTVHRILAASSQAVMNTLPAARDQAMREVLAENYRATGDAGIVPRLDLLSDGLPGRLEWVPGSQGDLQSLSTQAVARYGFLAPRDATARNPWPVSYRCPQKRHELRRRGATSMGADGRWHAHDTLSFHALRSNRWIGCYYREYPMGWGDTDAAVDASSADPGGIQPPDDFSDQDFWRWVREHTDWNIQSGTANFLADAHAGVDRHEWRGRGFPPHAVLKGEASLRLAIAARMPAPALKTSDAAGAVRVAGERFAFRALQPNEYVHVASAAETYFARPHSRADGRRELASLFHPYWQARLSAVSATEQRAAGALHD